MSDAYRTLGVPSTADRDAIRAAYLALMKRYHPDQPGADPERAKAVAAAWRLIGDPKRRADYDREEAERTFGGLAGSPPGEAPRRRTGKALFFLTSAATVGLGYVALTRPLAESSAVPRAATVAPAENFVLADVGRTDSDLPAEPLPPAPEQPAEIDDIELPEVEQARPAERAKAPAKASVAPAKASAAQARASAQPAEAMTPAQIAEAQLAALERHQIILYNQSFLAGDEWERVRLMETRTIFLRRLEDCAGNECRRDLYLARNQEVAEIVGD